MRQAGLPIGHGIVNLDWLPSAVCRVKLYHICMLFNKHLQIYIMVCCLFRPKTPWMVEFPRICLIGEVFTAWLAGVWRRSS